MDFTSIGKIGSFVKQQNLIFAANYKIRTGQRIVDANGNLNFSKTTMFDQVNQAQQKKLTEADKARIAAIKQKLMSGKKLSDSEMAYLKDKDEKLYKKAKHAEEAREELKSELSKATTKQEARQAVTRAMMKASAEAMAELAAMKNGVGGGGIAAGGAESAMAAGEDVPIDGDVNLNVDGAETEGLLTANNEIISDFQEATGEITEATNENLAESADNQNEDNDKTSPFQNDNDGVAESDILEKFIMTIRALEDEWAQFTKSDRYKDMPEGYFDESENQSGNNKRLINITDSRTMDAILAYRNMYSGAV